MKNGKGEAWKRVPATAKYLEAKKAFAAASIVNKSNPKRSILKIEMGLELISLHDGLKLIDKLPRRSRSARGAVTNRGYPRHITATLAIHKIHLVPTLL